MAPIDSRLLVIQVLKFIICVLSSALQLHFVLLTQVMMHQHSLNQEFLDAIEEKYRALYRYRQLRSRFMRRKKKRYWKNPGRTEKWWQNMLDGSMLPEEWIVNFRMCRNDFMKLEEKLRPYIRPSKDSFRGDTICSVKKLAMTLYYLKDQGSLRMTSNLFGIAPTTLSATIRKVCHAITTVLGPQLIKFPTTKDDLQHLTSEFEKKFHFPMLAGCIDGTHIPIKQPTYLFFAFFTPELSAILAFTNQNESWRQIAIIHPRMPFSRVMKISFRPETKKVSAHMKISGRPENSDRPEKAK